MKRPPWSPSSVLLMLKSGQTSWLCNDHATSNVENSNNGIQHLLGWFKSVGLCLVHLFRFLLGLSILSSVSCCTPLLITLHPQSQANLIMSMLMDTVSPPAHPPPARRIFKLFKIIKSSSDALDGPPSADPWGFIEAF